MAVNYKTILLRLEDVMVSRVTTSTNGSQTFHGLANDGCRTNRTVIDHLGASVEKFESEGFFHFLGNLLAETNALKSFVRGGVRKLVFHYKQGAPSGPGK